jgi:hypothetical protein
MCEIVTRATDVMASDYSIEDPAGNSCESVILAADSVAVDNSMEEAIPLPVTTLPSTHLT